MHRRSMLSCLGASVAGALHPVSSIAASARKDATGLLSLESFCAHDIDHMPALHSYLSETLQPAMDRIHGTPALYLEAVIAPQAPQVLAVTHYAGFDEMLSVRDQVSSNRDVLRGRAQLESNRTLKETNSEVLVAAQGSSEPARTSAHLKNGIIELCSFSAPDWQNGPPPAVSESFSRAGIHPAAGALYAPGSHLSRFTYLIPFKNMAAATEAWARLEQDTNWSGVRLASKAIYKLAPYSRLS